MDRSHASTGHKCAPNGDQKRSHLTALSALRKDVDVEELRKIRKHCAEMTDGAGGRT